MASRIGFRAKALAITARKLYHGWKTAKRRKRKLKKGRQGPCNGKQPKCRRQNAANGFNFEVVFGDKANQKGGAHQPRRESLDKWTQIAKKGKQKRRSKKSVKGLAATGEALSLRKMYGAIQTAMLSQTTQDANVVLETMKIKIGEMVYQIQERTSHTKCF